jgi:hypothetical protein
MIQGLRTAIYPVSNLAEGKAWHTRALERSPYFDEPLYVGYLVGGFEFGLIPDGIPSSQGVRVCWGAPDAAQELARLQGLGASVHETVKDLGGGLNVAGVLDPFGNVFWIIENPYFKLKDVR